MPGKALTEQFVKGLKPEPGRQVDFHDLSCSGLSLRTNPNGTKTWFLRYSTPTGQRRRDKLGRYPDTTLAEARRRAQDHRRIVEKGGDPVAECKRLRKGDGTLDSLAEEYFSAALKGLHGGRQRPKRDRTLALERQRYQAHVAPKLGRRGFTNITRGDVRELQRSLTVAGDLSANTVAGVLNALRCIFAFAAHEERIEVNPVLGVKSGSLPSRERHWSAEEARQLYAAFRVGSAVAEPVTALFLRFLALTLVRRDEARLAEWNEFNLRDRIWTVPGSRMKNGRTHVVPLSDETMSVLEAAREICPDHDGFVFPSPRRDASPLNKDAPFHSLRRTCAAIGVPHGGLHDWRRTGATLLTSEHLGQRRFFVSLVLAHSAGDGAAVTALYDRNDYLREKREALQAWGRWLSCCDADNVVDFATRRA